MSSLPVHDKLTYVLGAPENFSARPSTLFASDSCALLARLSSRLTSDPATRTMPDAMAFAWWCRKASLERLAKCYDDGVLRLGRGLAFHVTPSNMPVNFAFSWAFSLLAGNANVVRVPNREFPQIPFLLDHLRELLRGEEFAELRRSNAFVSFGREREITEAFSAIADARLIWGGDATIAALRKIPSSPRGVDVCFADRYSFCVLGAKPLLAMEAEALQRFVAGFYNDAYIMDQNACSSPRLVVWLGGKEEAERAGERLWPALEAELERRYEIPAVSAMDKFTQACRDAIELDNFAGVCRADSRLYRVRLDSLMEGIDARRCHSGYFYEYTTEDLDEVAAIVHQKYQTLTYYGVPAEVLRDFVVRNRAPGIDRIVPVGEALNIGLIWDGYDLVRTLSRICDIH